MRPSRVRGSFIAALFVLAFAAGAQERPVASTAVIDDTFRLVLSGTTKGTYSVAGGSGPTVTGAASGDTILRAETQRIVLSANAASTGQFAFTPAGYLGIGTMDPLRQLHIIGPDGPVPSFPTTAIGPKDLLVLENNYNTNLSFIAAGPGYSNNIRFAKSGDAAQSGGISFIHGDNVLLFHTSSAERMRLTGTGRMGIGTLTPISALHQYTNTADNPITAAISDAGGKDGLLTLNSGAIGQAGGGGGILFGGNGNNQFFAGIKSLLANGSGNTTGDLAFATRNTTADGALTERMRITATGTVGIGAAAPNPAYMLHVQGSGRFEGPLTGVSISAQFQDVAEWVPANDALTAGTVVVIDRSAPNTVAASKTAYDTAVAGVVSEQPGILLGVAGPNKVRVATTGRVKVRADARYGPIALGDLLVTSETPGVVMRSEPMTVNGRTFHQPGTLVGKALESLAQGTGEILVLLSLQ